MQGFGIRVKISLCGLSTYLCKSVPKVAHERRWREYGWDVVFLLNGPESRALGYKVSTSRARDFKDQRER